MTAFAVPTSTSGIGQTGTRRFVISEDGVMRRAPTLTGPPDEKEAGDITPKGN